MFLYFEVSKAFKYILKVINKYTYSIKNSLFEIKYKWNSSMNEKYSFVPQNFLYSMQHFVCKRFTQDKRSKTVEMSKQNKLKKTVVFADWIGMRNPNLVVLNGTASVYTFSPKTTNTEKIGKANRIIVDARRKSRVYCRNCNFKVCGLLSW